MKIEVEGVELTVTQTKTSVSVTRVVGRDRKRKKDITNGVTFNLVHHIGEEAVTLLENMKQVAEMSTARCRCDYRYGFSDHAEHCQSIYVATYDGGHGYD